MDQNQNEPNQDGLENLPQKEQEETRSILEEIAKSESPKGDEPAKDQKPADGKPEEKPAEPKEPKGETGKDDKNSDGKPADDKKPDEGRRPFKMVPAYLLEKQEKEHQKMVAQMKSDFEKAAKTAAPSSNAGDGDKPTSEIIKAKAKAIAEKHGIDEAAAADILSAAIEQGGKMPAEVAEAIADLKKAREETAMANELTKFSTQFDRDILPLLKAEYGEDVPQSVIDQTREQLKELAYSKPEYEKTPYKVIFKGDDSFRGLVAPKKKGSEGGRGGTVPAAEANRQDGPDLSKPLPDAELKSLSDKDFDTYTSNMEKLERAGRK